MNRRALLLGFLTLPIAARLRPSAPLYPIATGAGANATSYQIFRADAALTPITRNGGMLTGDQARRFYEIMVEESMFLPATDPETWPRIS